MFFNPKFILWLAGGLLVYSRLKEQSAQSSGKAPTKRGQSRKKGPGKSPDNKKAGSPSQPDDLTVIPGVGAKVAGELNKAGISTFAQLAKADEKDLKSHFEGKPGYRLMNPARWIAEAKEQSKRG